MTYQLFDENTARGLFHWTRNNVPWESVVSYSLLRKKWIRTPRLQCAYSKDGILIEHNDTPAWCNPHNHISRGFIGTIRNATGFKGNYVLLNRYQSGSECIALHTDSIRGLVQGSPIVMVSLYGEN